MADPGAPPPPLPYKRFVWLMQAGTLPRKLLVRPTADRDVIWLTYHDQSGDVYFPNSSYSQGRNRLLDEAMARAVRMPRGGYLYYVFMDGDVKLLMRKNTAYYYRPRLPTDPYACFEAFLWEWQPAAGSVAYSILSHHERVGTSLFQNTDALLQAQHRETLSFGLPCMDLDCHSSYYQQHVMNSINTLLYNTRRVQMNAIMAVNRAHGFAPTYRRRRQWQDARCFVKNALQPASPLHGGFVQDPLPKFTTGQAQPRGNASYLVPFRFLRQHFNLSHPLVLRSLRFRARPDVRQLLRAAAQQSPRRSFVPDPRGCNPNGKELDRRCFRGTCRPDSLLLCPWGTPVLPEAGHPS
eukprot:EG_transcript_14970